MSDVWDSWAELTRFLESARLAFARERNLWQSLELADPDQASIRVRSGGGWYKARLDQHVDAVNDEITLYASVLIHSYALMESAAAEALSMNRVKGGVSGWGRLLLNKTSSSWDDVRDGEAGAVEVAVVRHAFAHGTREIDSDAVKQLADVGAPAREVGDAVTLTYSELLAYRGRMASLLNTSGLARS
ncbi:MAG: hypothetical protein ABIR39_09555 [Nocardioides sp.]|uniref:hypothetical protein n=1 Tax=Nocardioides sp. TaxID=35761 RepID=UPI00326734AA